MSASVRVMATSAGEALLAATEQALFAALRGGDASAKRRALAKAITLIESTRADHRRRADQLLDAVLPVSGGSMRIGISGAPGAGKSSFIEALGLILVGRGRQVAVLAVDPSSSLSGGSVLGDKTRMVRLAAHPLAFIRPSPSGGTLGGVAAKTREAIFLCEAAGFDVVVVETIGVGQSEVAVADMTDLFVLLQLPNTGDELQAIKKGALELAQLILINKADLDPPAAQRAQAQIEAGLRLVAVPRAGGAIDPPPVLRVSALRGDGIAEVWQAVEALFTRSASNGDLAARRRAQSVAWLWQQIEVGLMQRFRSPVSPRRTSGTTTGGEQWGDGRVSRGAAPTRRGPRPGWRGVTTSSPNKHRRHSAPSRAALTKFCTGGGRIAGK